LRFTKRGAGGSRGLPFDDAAATRLYNTLRRQLAHWQRRLLHNLHNEWAKRDIAKIEQLWPDDVHYDNNWIGPEQCHACVMFVPPHACKLVKGTIWCYGHCDRFYPKVAKAQTPLWPWIDDVIDDSIDEPSQSSMRDVAGALADAYAGARATTIRELDPYKPGAISIRSQSEAIDYAAARGAEMVGRRYDADGNLVDHPSADWAITDTMRDVLRNEIRVAVGTHMDVDKLADHIADTGAFSDYRAEMIARTEVSMAQNQGILEAGRQAQAAGLDVKKVWTLGDNPCPLCEDAAAEGQIDLDEDFGGDAGDAPPLHPNCECTLDLITDSEDRDTDRDEAEEAVDDAIDSDDAVEGYEPGDKTPTPDIKLRQQVVQDWADVSPITTLTRVMAAAPEDQRLLVKVGDVVANDVGAVVKQGGHKVQTRKGIDRVLEKAAEKYHGQISRVTDVARMTLIVQRPQQADEAIKELSQYFEVASEPWKPTDVHYADRAVNLRLPDGLVAEVQFMDQRMADAKAVGGHKQFKIMQDSAKAGAHPDKARWQAAFKASRAIYDKVIDSYSDEWKAALGRIDYSTPEWKALGGSGGSGPNI